VPLIKDGKFARDTWHALPDDAPLPPGGDITVSHARWTKERDGLSQRQCGCLLGLRLPNTVSPATIADDLAFFALIVLDFPKFVDGRAYSQARLLRTRFGFKGELRAAGNVLRDELQFMERCGIDAFDVPERAIAEDWLASLRDFDVFYQPSQDGRPWVMGRKLRQA
jgi:uncharacterized protein (DUF934 family)